ncbi:hypothetical protein APSETT444_007207 [Aspergillus pseudonomiae]
MGESLEVSSGVTRIWTQTDWEQQQLRSPDKLCGSCANHKDSFYRSMVPEDAGVSFDMLRFAADPSFAIEGQG